MPGTARERRMDALDFIRSMLGQLHGMAEGERLSMLSYFIEMAYIEASDMMRSERASQISEQGDKAA